MNNKIVLLSVLILVSLHPAATPFELPSLGDYPQTGYLTQPDRQFPFTPTLSRPDQPSSTSSISLWDRGSSSSSASRSSLTASSRKPPQKTPKRKRTKKTVDADYDPSASETNEEKSDTNPRRKKASRVIQEADQDEKKIKNRLERRKIQNCASAQRSRDRGVALLKGLQEFSESSAQQLHESSVRSTQIADQMSSLLTHLGSITQGSSLITELRKQPLSPPRIHYELGVLSDGQLTTLKTAAAQVLAQRRQAAATPMLAPRE